MVIDALTVFPNKENFCFIDTGLMHYVALAWSRSGLSSIAKELVMWLKSALG